MSSGVGLVLTEHLAADPSLVLGGVRCIELGSIEFCHSHVTMPPHTHTLLGISYQRSLPPWPSHDNALYRSRLTDASAFGVGVVGSGTGILSLGLAMLGVDVVATDMEEVRARSPLDCACAYLCCLFE